MYTFNGSVQYQYCNNTITQFVYSVGISYLVCLFFLLQLELGGDFAQ